MVGSLQNLPIEHKAVPDRLLRAVVAGLVVLAIFAPQVVGGLYAGLGRRLPESYSFLCALFLTLSVTAWFALYSQEYRIPWVMDMGWFLLVAWVVIVPYYVLRREGRSGLWRVGLFCLMWFGAWATGIAVRIGVQVLLPGE